MGRRGALEVFVWSRGTRVTDGDTATSWVRSQGPWGHVCWTRCMMTVLSVRSVQAEGTRFSGWVTRAEGRLPGGGRGGRKHSGQDDVLWGRGKCGLAHVRLGPRVSQEGPVQVQLERSGPGGPELTRAGQVPPEQLLSAEGSLLGHTGPAQPCDLWPSALGLSPSWLV